MRRLRCVVDGRVQGVCYRMAAVDEAKRLGLCGWVRNLDDGRVEVAAEGEETALKALLDWCRSGPPLAIVRDVAWDITSDVEGFSGFEVRYGARSGGHVGTA